MSKRRFVLFLVVAVGVALFLAAGAGAYVTTFDFHKGTLTNSTLTIYRQDTLDGRILNQQSWRSGSGQNTNECDSANNDKIGGWLPNGYYNIWGHFDNYDASDIKGRVWHFQDKACYNGSVVRTELFIHSEETAAQGQSCPTAGDDPFCWEGTSDYYSNGCMKIAHATPYPSDVAQLHSDWDAWSGLHGSFTLQQRLFVY